MSAEMTSEKERKRSTNWPEEERLHLFYLIAERVSILESKKSDSNSQKKKTVAWAEVHREHTASYGQIRTLKKIKDQWRRMKITAKKEVSEYQKERKRTGGGPEPPEPKKISVMIKELLPLDFVQIINPFDDDAEDLHVEAETASTATEESSTTELINVNIIPNQDEDLNISPRYVISP